MPMNRTEFMGYLWDAAVIWDEKVLIHSGADSYKQYILSLLFLKRICDVYDEEYALALKESGGDADYAEFAEHHRFAIPKGHHWKDIREASADIGKAIQKALDGIERANSGKFLRIFGGAVWTDKNRLPDNVLKNLVEHLSSQNLSIANCPDDEFVAGYEYLIKKFADDGGHYSNITIGSLPKP